MQKHKDLVDNHRLETWVYATAASRIAAGGFATTDVGRIAYQQDTGQYWRLTVNSPAAWALITGNLGNVQIYTYGSAALRLAASGFASTEVGNWAYQTDTGQYWRLANYSPIVWQLVSPNQIETWVYASTGARTGATGMVANDVGRIAYQSDTAQYWRMNSQSAGIPTWISMDIPYAIEAWSYANSGARTGATGFTNNDVGRIAYQTDSATYWRLFSQAAGVPTWTPIVGNATAYATLQTASVSPTGNSTLGYLMVGLGTASWGTAVITPNVSGNIFATISGSLLNTSTGGAVALMVWGTGTAPNNGAAVIGTQIGGAATRNINISGTSVPFSLSYLLTGRTLGQQIWLDLEITATSTGTAQASNVAVSAFEVA